MIRYYKLFDLLNRRNMNKSDLLEIISSKTIAKLSKGANLNTDIIDKICLYLECQPSDIMEVIEIQDKLETIEEVGQVKHYKEEVETTKKKIINEYPEVTEIETRLELRNNDEDAIKLTTEKDIYNVQ